MTPKHHRPSPCETAAAALAEAEACRAETEKNCCRCCCWCCLSERLWVQACPHRHQQCPKSRLPSRPDRANSGHRCTKTHAMVISLRKLTAESQEKKPKRGKSMQ